MKKVLFNILVLGSSVIYAQEVNSNYSRNAIELYGQDINNGDARYIGVGGAVGALGGSVSSAEQNPAGVGTAISSEVQITAGVSSFRNENKFASKNISKGNEFDIQQIGGLFVFDINDSKWNRFSIGVNYINQNLNRANQTNSNQNISFNNTDTEGNVLDTYRFAGYSEVIDGYKSKFSVNFATAYDEKLYLGLGLNFHETNYSAYNQYAERSDNTGNTYTYNQNGSPYSEIGQGFSLSLGAIYKFNYNVRAGLAYHSPTWYNVSEQFWQASISKNKINSYSLFGSEYDMTRGGRVVGSLGFVAGKNLSFGADYTLHMNNSTKLKPSNDFISNNAFINNYVRNSNEIRVGGEYRLDKFRGRLGYNFIESPYKSLTLDATNANNITSLTTINKPYVGDINRISAGLGYDLGGFYIDAAYQYQTQKTKNVIGNALYVDNQLYNVELDNNYVNDIKLKNNLFLLTLGWRF